MKLQGQKYSLLTAIALVISNMIGIGVFTSLGFQVVDIKSAPVIILLWFLGGVVALTGALSYAEISTVLKKSGGEYHYLTVTYSRALGFIGGWISLFVGFAAPICAISIAIGKYSAAAFGMDISSHVSGGVLILMTLLHLKGIQFGSFLQNFLTVVKLLLILAFIIGIFYLGPTGGTTVSFELGLDDLSSVFGQAFFVSMVYVYFSYAGWNASTYVAELVENPSRNLPLSLIIGTLIVTILYMVLNGAFLYASGFARLSGKVEVAHVVALDVFGETAAPLVSGFLSLSLLGSLSALIVIGPRVLEMMGKDYERLKVLSKKNKSGIPYIAIILQSLVAGLLMLTSTFDFILKYVGMTLSMSSVLTVIGLFILRTKMPNIPRVFKVWGYPYIPLIFIIFNLVMIIFLSLDNPYVLVWSFLTILSGFVTFKVIN